jgi:acyl-coenzyme A synthetase/AMP-(fatty) acid ligase
MKEVNYLLECITGHSRSSPGKTAVKYGDKSVSYLELERKSNGIAHILHKQIKQNRNVIIILDRSPELIESIIGVLKCGSVFVPVDPLFPVSRVETLINETGAEWVIISRETREKFGKMIAGKNCNVLLIDDIDTEVSGLEFEKIYNKYCYIYFTSGSTGKPKGVLGRL